MIREEAIKILESIDNADEMDEEFAEAYNMAIKALEKEPCEDCISRRDVIDIINFEDIWLYDAKSHNEDTKIAFNTLKSYVRDLPSVAPKTESEE